MNLGLSEKGKENEEAEEVEKDASDVEEEAATSKKQGTEKEGRGVLGVGSREWGVVQYLHNPHTPCVHQQIKFSSCYSSNTQTSQKTFPPTPMLCFPLNLPLHFMNVLHVYRT
jgi:hypothetical protein